MSVARLDQQFCTACGACINGCEFSAIQMKSESEGFYYPDVSDDCTECGACEKVCPQLNAADLRHWNKAAKGWLALGTDGKLIQHSASGGAFATFAKFIIKELEGVVFGACMDKDFFVRHKYAQSLTDLEPMLGSKYVQSDSGLNYSVCRRFLEEGRFVLYSGTPCQIAGLNSYLGKQYEKLITVDIVCHGVSAPLAFRAYMCWLSEKAKMEVISYRFRNRTKYDRAGFISKVVFHHESGKEKTLWRTAERDVYFKAYLDGNLFRKSCYSCLYAQEKRISDITIGDCNSYNCYKNFHPYEASSIILLNSSAGEQFWKAVSSQFYRVPVDVPAEMKANAQLHKPSELPEKRDIVCKDFVRGQFEAYEKSLFEHMTVFQRMRIWSKTHVPLKLRMKISTGTKRLKRKVNNV